MVVMQPAMMLILNLTSVLIVDGVAPNHSGNLEIGNMIAFMQYAMQVIMAFLMISIVFIWCRALRFQPIDQRSN